MAKFMNIATAALLLATAACGEKGAGDAATAKPSTTTTTTTAATDVAKPGANRDWTQLVVATPEGGFRMGNPDAKVKFLEFASLTCPHCRDFNKEAAPALRAQVATGQVSYEFRNFVLNGYDLAVSVAARCQAPAAFFRSIDGLYGTQLEWMDRYIKLPPERMKAIQAMPRDRQLIAIADAGKLDEFFRLRGMSRANYEACLKDEKNVTRLQAIADEAVKKYNLQGTPTFVLNGETKPDLHTWPQVEAAIKAALG